ncbi:MAG: hypothetical protein M3440_14125 [Chloroflexota bacterium]|nr:hypothetical protein [Chloroflexota bacterium]
MPRPRGKGRDGLPVDLIGKALVYRLSPIPGTRVGIRTVGQQEITTMSDNTAKSDGVYTLDEGRFVIRAGDRLPAGAKFEAQDDVFAPSNAEFVAEDVEIVDETKAQPANDDRRSLTGAPENRSLPKPTKPKAE